MNTYSFIKGFQDFSLCDWPGRNVAVIFTGGCNLRCPTCHKHGSASKPIILPGLIPRKSAAICWTKKTGWTA